MRKDFTLSLVLLTLLISAPLYAQDISPIAGEAKMYFEDVSPEHWAYEAVNSLAQKGIIVGEIKEGKRIYRGEEPLTRYEFAQGLKRAVERFENDLAALKEGLARREAVSAGVGAKEGGFVRQDELKSLKNTVINLDNKLSSLKTKVSVLEESLAAARMAEAKQAKAVTPEETKSGKELKRLKILSTGAVALSILAIIMAISK